MATVFLTAVLLLGLSVNSADQKAELNNLEDVKAFAAAQASVNEGVQYERLND